MMWALFTFYFLLGLCFQFPSVAMRFWLIDTVGVSPAQMAAIFGVVAIPWCLKPLYGFVSDSNPIFGYRRRPYMIVGAYVSSVMWILLPFCPHDEFIITCVMTGSSLGLCVADVMADSLLVEAARRESEQDQGTVQSWSWLMRFAGGLAASVLGAVAYDHLGAAQVFLLNSMFPIVIAVAACFIPDAPATEVYHWKTTTATLWGAIRQPEIYKPALFIFLLSATPGYGEALTFFYQHELKFTPDEFGALDVIGYIVSMTGAYIYKRCLRHVSFVRIFTWALVISFVLENTLFILVFHLNRPLGIPDYVFAAVERVILTLVGELVIMPMVVLGARVCPVGVEGTLYALLMSISNIAGVVSSEWGSLLTKMFGVTAVDFSALWKLMLVCHALDLIPILSVRLVRNVTPETSI